MLFTSFERQRISTVVVCNSTYLSGRICACIALGGEYESVDEGLWMNFAKIREKIVNERCHENFGGVDASDELRYDLEPYFHGRLSDARVEHFIDIGRVTVIEPESEQTQSVLQAVGLLVRDYGWAKFDALKEAFDWKLHIWGCHGIWRVNDWRSSDIVVEFFVVLQRFVVHVSPRMPRFVRIVVMIFGWLIVVDYCADRSVVFEFFQLIMPFSLNK